MGINISCTRCTRSDRKRRMLSIKKGVMIVATVVCGKGTIQRRGILGISSWSFIVRGPWS